MWWMILVGGVALVGVLAVLEDVLDVIAWMSRGCPSLPAAEDAAPRTHDESRRLYG